MNIVRLFQSLLHNIDLSNLKNSAKPNILTVLGDKD